MVDTILQGGKCLGLELACADPITVISVLTGSIAELQGVEPGWVLTHVSGEDLQGMGFAEAFKVLERSATRAGGQGAELLLSPAAAGSGLAARAYLDGSEKARKK